MTTRRIQRVTTTRNLQEFNVQCSPRAYRVSWSLFLAFHLTHGGAYGRAIKSLIRTVRNPNLTIMILRLMGRTYSERMNWVTIVVAAAVVLYHFVAVFRMVQHSIRAKQLTFNNSNMRRNGDELDSNPQKPRSRFWILRRWSGGVEKFKKWTAMWGIRGPYFELGFTLREAYEIAWQANQAYRISYLVPALWVNQLAVAVLVLNCRTTPLVAYMYPREKALRRVLCLAVDILLDFTSAIVIPYASYTRYRDLLADEDWYNPIWILRLGNHFLQFVTMSPGDLFSRVIPAVGMISSLHSLQSLLKRYSDRQVSSRRPATIAPVSVRMARLPSSSAIATSIRPSKAPLGCCSKIFHVLVALYGFGALGLFLVSQSHTAMKEHPAGCPLSLMRWLAPKYPCGVLEINCHRHDFDGYSGEIASVLNSVDEFALAAIVISHCLSVEIPQQIRNFPNLIWFEIYNSTLRSWPQEASLTSLIQTRFSRLLLIHVNVTEFPPGLMLRAFLRR